MTQQTHQMDLYDRAVRLDEQRLEITREQARAAAEALVQGILTITPQARDVHVHPDRVVVGWQAGTVAFALDVKAGDYLPETPEHIELMDSIELGGCLQLLCNALREPRVRDLPGFTATSDGFVDLDLDSWKQGE